MGQTEVGRGGRPFVDLAKTLLGVFEEDRSSVSVVPEGLCETVEGEAVLLTEGEGEVKVAQQLRVAQVETDELEAAEGRNS